jgi:hypothetical protein
MFYYAFAFNQPVSSWDTSSALYMQNMFLNASSFNQNINTFTTNNITTFSGMFYFANSYNNNGVPLTINTSSATTMSGMFSYASNFNQNIGNLSIINVTDMTSILDNTGLSKANYNATLNGWASQAPNIQSNVPMGAAGLVYDTPAIVSRNLLINTYHWIITGDSEPSICFNEGTKILCLVDNQEIYIPIEDMRQGTLVKCYQNNYKKVSHIGKGKFINNTNTIHNCMYKCNDLILTGGHSILVDEITMEHLANAEKLNIKFKKEKIEDKYLVLSCMDNKFTKIIDNNEYTYYHFVLEGNKLSDKFGVYANDILVESCDKLAFSKKKYTLI